jgi:hypothetical protein
VKKFYSLILAFFLTLAGCGLKIDVVPKIFNDEFGPRSFQITGGSFLNSNVFPLTYGTIDGSYDEYCLLENNNDENLCSWTAGMLPTTFTVSNTEELSNIIQLGSELFNQNKEFTEKNLCKEFDTMNNSIIISNLNEILINHLREK